tara:strand:- start:228 stop:428 length:201 start_codon:yes stop_codon:yes gene_type:complete
MPQFTLTCTDEDETVTSKEFEATILNEVVEKTQDFLHGVGYCFEELQVKESIDTDDNDSSILTFNR